MQIGEAFVAVRADTSKFGAEATRGVEQGARKAKSSLDDLFSAQTLVGAGAVVGFSKLIGSASELEQAVGGTTAVFGEAGAAIDAFAENSADAVGLSEASYRSLASFAGNQLKGLGFSASDAAEQTNNLITMGADLAATFGGTTQEAVQALSATFRGEYDPVERYVAGLRASTVAAKAVELGLAESGGAISNYARGQATLALLTEGSADAQGQFAREADTAAGAQARAAAAAENSSAAIGENFLPVYNQAVGAVTALAQAFGALPGPLQTATVGLAGFIALRAPAVALFGTMSGSIGQLKTALIAVKGAFLGAQVASTSASAAMLASLGPWAALAGLVVAIHTGVVDLTGALTEAEMDTQNVDAMTASMIEAGSASEGLRDHLSDVSEFDPSFFTALGTNVDELASALLGGEAAWDTFVDRVTGNLPEGADVGAFTEGLELHRERALASADAMGETTAANEAAGGAADTASSALTDEAEALSGVADSASTALDALDALFGIQRTAAEGMIAVRDGARDLYAAFLDLGERGFRAGTEGSDAFQSAMQDQLVTIGEQTVALVNNGSSIQEARAAQRGWIADAVNLARAAGVPEAAIQDMVDTFGTVPRRLLTDVEQRGAEEVQEQARNTREAVNKIPKFGRVEITANNRQAMLEIDEARRAAEAWARMTYTAQLHVAVSGATPGAAFGRSARGGPIGAGDIHLVGEEGPELFMPENSGQIIPNDKLFGNGHTPIGTAGAGGNVTVIVEGNVIGDVERFADEIAFRAAEKISRGAI